MSAKMLQLPTLNSLNASIVGEPGTLAPAALPPALYGALDGALNVDPQQGDPAPVDTRTKQQRAADDAAGKVYDPATGTYTTPTDDTPTDVPSWIPDSVKWLFSPEWLQGKLGKLGFYVVLLVLGGAFVVIGTKTLAE